MSRKQFMTAILALAVILAVSAPVFAAGNSCQVSVPFAANIKGTNLAAGQYNLSWQGANPGLTVTVAKGKNVVATVQGKMEARNDKYPRNMVVFRAQPDGSQAVSEVRVGGTNQAIVFSEQAGI